MTITDLLSRRDIFSASSFKGYKSEDKHWIRVYHKHFFSSNEFFLIFSRMMNRQIKVDFDSEDLIPKLENFPLL